MTHLRGLRAAFDHEVRRTESAETLTEALRTHLFEEKTAHAQRQSLFESREKEVATLQRQLAENRSLIDGLHEALGPVSVMLGKFSTNKESGEKHQRDVDRSDEDGRGAGSSKRAKH